MRTGKDMNIFITHFDWYKEVPGVGYEPTEKAPEEAVEAMKRVNERSKKGLEA